MQYIDKVVDVPVAMLRQVPAAFRLSTEAVENPHISYVQCSRYSHLDSGLFSTSSLYMAGTRPGVLSSVYFCFQKNFINCLRDGCARAVCTWEIWTLFPRLLRIQQVYSSCALPGASVLGDFWTISPHFLREGELGHEATLVLLSSV